MAPKEDIGFLLYAIEANSKKIINASKIGNCNKLLLHIVFEQQSNFEGLL